MQREIYLEIIRQTEEVMHKTNSKYCRRDFEKSRKRIKRTLYEYDRYHDETGGTHEIHNS